MKGGDASPQVDKTNSAGCPRGEGCLLKFKSTAMLYRLKE